MRFDGVDADVADAAGGAGGHDRLVGRQELLHRQVQLPAELADIVDAQGQGAAEAELDLARRQPGEGGVGEVGRGDLLQHLARGGAGDHQRAEAAVQALEARAAVGGQGGAQQILVVPFGRAGARPGRSGPRPAG